MENNMLRCVSGLALVLSVSVADAMLRPVSRSISPPSDFVVDEVLLPEPELLPIRLVSPRTQQPMVRRPVSPPPAQQTQQPMVERPVSPPPDFVVDEIILPEPGSLPIRPVSQPTQPQMVRPVSPPAQQTQQPMVRRPASPLPVQQTQQQMVRRPASPPPAQQTQQQRRDQHPRQQLRQQLRQLQIRQLHQQLSPHDIRKQIRLERLLRYHIPLYSSPLRQQLPAEKLIIDELHELIRNEDTVDSIKSKIIIAAEHGSIMSCADKDGNTLLHTAVSSERADVVELLLSTDIVELLLPEESDLVCSRNKSGISPMQLLTLEFSEELRELFTRNLKNMARDNSSVEDITRLYESYHLDILDMFS